MKKMFFFAAVASVAFVSCTKDVETPANNVGSNEPAITFEVGSPLSVSTRGKGAVGGTGIGSDVNTWKGETLNVFMFEKGTMNLAFNQTTNAYYFENAEIIAPNGTSSAAGVASGIATYGDPQYFPSSGDFDFYAYHGDDAVVGILSLYDTQTSLKAAVEIDGTQDLMIAKAGLNKTDSTTYEKADSYNYERIYSAYAARRGVNPRFTFKHLLSRFVFQAEAAQEAAAGANGIKITKIVVKAPSVGVMTIASLDEKELGVVFGNEATDSLDMYLHPCNDEGEMVAKELVYGENVRLGESMLLPAGATEYVADIYYEQTKDNGTTIYDIYTAPIILKGNKPFEAGYQYKVNIKVYDFQEIKLTADLQAWKEGEDIPVDSEQ